MCSSLMNLLLVPFVPPAIRSQEVTHLIPKPQHQAMKEPLTLSTYPCISALTVSMCKPDCNCTLLSASPFTDLPIKNLAVILMKGKANTRCLILVVLSPHGASVTKESTHMLMISSSWFSKWRRFSDGKVHLKVSWKPRQNITWNFHFCFVPGLLCLSSTPLLMLLSTTTDLTLYALST